MVYSLKNLQKYQFPQIVLLVFLLIILVVGTLPGYVAGKWSWENTAKITNLKSLKQIRKDGLTIPDLTTTSHQEITIADHKWLLQKIDYENKSVTLLLLTQNGQKDQPQVEWMDINGYYRWKTDSYKRVSFTSQTPDGDSITDSGKQNKSDIEARFFRSWTNKQTYAVMQWYAWPGGGSPKPGDWFWTDRLAMVSRNRVPWVAVNILFPIEPLGDIDPYLPQLTSIGQKIQASLLTKEAFK
ncbi:MULTISPECIES: cyanoexosortase B system-associated protein [Okeania]|uniref:Cyanoexosortase B system-associated protein n=1 Tax=Okeania hirsuta TaxID=1458930 RepID=A0A3N6RK54_9CYAN|nr:MULTISPECIES: cyanoexosortase B system-associated protein [Okeania]NET16684.1 cyanoexosortase B system-associated protein [Okeania sp. SIO1H6]NES77447.1 cyanoexosortase B system-associated protein [Okeania sp. SIO1H4]NET20953.1 cyanoexosortase B system-associated protein [Okeania sp. SIO1H5]NET77788.1 cyanoexosortase B system-associated protein [Okeania sp. SIO1F9]NET96628.1 cyanoexosortase B system-associated protein [Okeania sp. SIO1H2]